MAYFQRKTKKLRFLELQGLILQIEAYLNCYGLNDPKQPDHRRQSREPSAGRKGRKKQNSLSI